MKRKKIIHLPWNIGGQPQTLSNYMKNHKWRSETWVISENWLRYEADYIITRNNDSQILIFLKKLFALRYLFKSDVVFFNFGSTLFAPFPISKQRSNLSKLAISIYNKISTFIQKTELKILKLRHVPMLIIYQGGDARQGDWSIKHQKISIAQYAGPEYDFQKNDDLKRRKIKLLTEYCDKVYALNPDLLNILPSKASFLPYSNVDLDAWRPKPKLNDSGILRIGHAPTNRSVKGTKYIVDAVSRLQAKNLKFEFILIEKLDHKAAREVYESLDLFVDQLLAGWYGGAAVELMALGVPVVAYIREEDLRFINPKMKYAIPIINADPSSIEEILEDLIKKPKSFLTNLGLKSRKYVEDWHNPELISKKILLEIEEIIIEKTHKQDKLWPKV